ncbi:MAG: hypothetical protein ACRDOJ_07600, partial [Nocardioidaceae bacterium]
DDADISGWRHRSESTSGEEDLTAAYVAGHSRGGDTLVHFGVDRRSVEGSANLGFWLLKGDVTPVSGGGFSGGHHRGDLLVLAHYEQGGTWVRVRLLKWVGSGGDAGIGGRLQTILGGRQGRLADCDSARPGDAVCANVGPVSLIGPGSSWSPVHRPASGVLPGQPDFEGVLNLSALFGTTPCFGGFVAETRSSFDVGAELGDLVHLPFELCDAQIQITGSDVYEVGEDHDFVVTATQSVGGARAPAADGTDVDVQLTTSHGASLDLIDDTCDTDRGGAGTIDGTCAVTFDSTRSGMVTGLATADVPVGDTVLHLETDGSGENSGAVGGRFVDARVRISDGRVGGIGVHHTLVTDVDVDLGDGNGFVPATDGHASVRLDEDAGAMGQVDAGTCNVATARTQEGDNLDKDGRCTVTFTSDTAGTVAAQAGVRLRIPTPHETLVLVRETDGSAGNSDRSVSRFVSGTMDWTTRDTEGALVGHAGFEACRTDVPDESITGEPAVDVPDRCMGVVDNEPPDVDERMGHLRLEGVPLGRYVVTETEATPGYAGDPETALALLDTDHPSVSMTRPFVQTSLRSLIVLTCNPSTGRLVESEVDLDGMRERTLDADQLPPGVSERQLCDLGGARYDGLPPGAHAPQVRVPDPATLPR